MHIRQPKKAFGKSRKKPKRIIEKNPTNIDDERLFKKSSNKRWLDLPQEADQEIEYDYLVKQGDKLWRRNLRFEPKKRNLKVKQSLYQKGFDLDTIQRFITEKEEESE